MEVKKDEISQEQWEEMKKIIRENVCPDCGAELQIHTNPEKGTIEVGCLNREHHGYIERETYTQAFRRGAEIHPAIRDAIERKMVPKDELGRAMNLLALRYPDAIKDQATAALFIMDCARLDIDPLIQPAEAVPVPFKSRKKDGKGNVIEEKVTVQMIVTADGWLSMAARGCKEDWVGPPRTMRLEEYLTTLAENKGKTREEIETIAKAIKESDCKDKEAWYYVAIGRRRDGEETVIPGWFTHKDHKQAEDRRLPASTQPGNQARVRAIKRWVREVFPECRQKMMDLTAEWYRRSEGIKEAQEYIDAEYSFISTKGGGKIGAPRREARGEKTPVSPPTKPESEKIAGAPPAELEGEGFHIDLPWLEESLNALKWTDETAKTFLLKYKVSPQGSLEDVIKRLTREQAEEFVKEIQERVAQKQMQLFE